jgi:imidazolonepropionase
VVVTLGQFAQLPSESLAARVVLPRGAPTITAPIAVALDDRFQDRLAGNVHRPALAERELGYTPAEALWSATAGGAAALRRVDVGALSVGRRADLAVLDAPSYVHLAYRPGVPLVTQTWVAGESIAG